MLKFLTWYAIAIAMSIFLSSFHWAITLYPLSGTVQIPWWWKWSYYLQDSHNKKIEFEYNLTVRLEKPRTVRSGQNISYF